MAAIDVVLARLSDLAAGGRLKDASRLFDALSPEDAARVTRAAGAARLRALVAAVARGSDAHPAVAAEQADVARDAIALDLVVARTIARVHEALAAESCRHLFLKGACFRETLYATTWIRSMMDVDVLIHPLDARKGLRALRGAGFRPASLDPAHPVTEALARQVPFVAPDRGPGVEAHFGLHDDLAGWRVDVDGLFRRATATPSGIPTLSWEDHVLHASIHLARVAFRQTLRHVLDVHRVLTTRTPDPGVLAGRARAWGCASALHLTLEASRFAFGTEVDPALLRATAPGGPGGAVLRAIVQPGRAQVPTRFEDTGTRWLGCLLAIDHPRSRAAFVATKVLTRALDRGARTFFGG